MRGLCHCGLQEEIVAVDKYSIYILYTCISGARVILACRNETAGRAAAEEIRKETSNINVVFMKLNLSSFKSIRDLVEKFNESK